MKRTLSLILACLLCLSILAGCSQTPAPTQQSTTAETTSAPTQPVLTGPEALQGKKIIFLGNSYTFWGQTVIHKGYEILTQEERSNDQGYFYQLCKAKGIDVAVTNWTFGSHNLTDFFATDGCAANTDCNKEFHQYFLKDAYFDYVVLQPYSEPEYKGNLIDHLQTAMDFFRAANPNVRFIVAVPHMAAEASGKYRWYKDLTQLKDTGILVCNWGGMLDDLSNGTVSVPGAEMTYSRRSFVVSKDDHHENLLAGYITSLMVYCAITGESAVGQPYDFCDNSELNPLFDLDAFKEKNYPDGISNFVEIFRSEADMLGLQQLTDEYLAK